MLASKFIEAELNAYIEEQRLTESPLVVKLIVKAFEAYDKYKRLVSSDSNLNEVQKDVSFRMVIKDSGPSVCPVCNNKTRAIPCKACNF